MTDKNDPRLRKLYILHVLTNGAGNSIKNREDAIEVVLKYGLTMQITKEEIENVLNSNVAEVLLI